MPVRPPDIEITSLARCWVRFEPRSRDPDFSRGLALRSGDPLWLLARQWQLGELQGEDAGSPVSVVAHASVSPVETVRFGAGETTPLDALPPEVVVEREPPPMTLRLRVQIGASFERALRRLAGQHASQIIASYRAALGLELPDPAELTTLDPVSARRIRFLAGRIVDGERLRIAVESNALPELPATIDGSIVALIVEQATAALDLASVYSLPENPDQRGWQADRLCHSFELESGPGHVSLIAREHRRDRVDWFDVSVGEHGEGDWRSLPPARGMPSRLEIFGRSARWWSFEDGQLNLSRLETQSTDLARALLVDFAALQGDDWFRAVLPAPVGHLVRIDELEVVDVFGQHHQPGPICSPTREPFWEVFTLAHDRQPRAPGAGSLLWLPRLAVGTLESTPLELLLLARDEGANLLWSFPARTLSALGDPLDTPTTELEPPRVPNPPSDSKGLPRYRVGDPPPHGWQAWIPTRAPELSFVPTSMPGVEPPPTPTSVLGHIDQIREFAIPRAPSQIHFTVQRARDQQGRTLVWFARSHALTDRFGLPVWRSDYFEEEG